MIRLTVNQQPRSVDVSVVPMINIVFLLLLYFLVAGRLVDDSGPVVQLPAGGGEKSAEPAALILHISADNTISSSGQTLNDADLDAHLSRLAQHPTRKLLVRADAGADVQTLHKIMRSAQAINLASFELATLERQ